MGRLIRFVFVIAAATVVYSCQEKPQDAQQIVDKSIEAYGGQKLYNAELEFDFRDIHYRGFHHGGQWSYERFIQDDSLGAVHDVLNNNGFRRTANDVALTLDEEWAGKYSRSVNSVFYFFRIPFNLNDPAVNKKLIGEAEIAGQPYYKVHISFDEEGGGEDHDDAFVYWFHQESYIIDYMAYSYSTDGGGKRFRKMINPRTVNGLLVVDYINYEPKDPDQPIESFDVYYETNGMKELSQIINRNVVVTYLQ